MLFKPLEGIMAEFVTVFNRASRCGKFSLVIVSDDDCYGAQGRGGLIPREAFNPPVRGLLTRLGEKDGQEVYRFQKSDSSPYWVLAGDHIEPVEGALVRVARGFGKNNSLTLAALGEKALVRINGETKAYHSGDPVTAQKSSLISALRSTGEQENPPAVSKTLAAAFTKAGYK